MSTMLPSKSRSGPNESPISRRPSTPSSNHRPSTPSSVHRPSTPGGTRRSIGGAPSTPRSRNNGAAGGGPFKSEPNSPPSATARPRLSFDRSPRSVDSKPVVERRVPKIGTPPDKQPRKEAELQSRLESAQEDLKKAKDQLAFIVGERDRLVGELNEAKRVADETHEKLQDALMAKRWAEEATEIEKFRADELEQAGIDEAQKREEEWQREIECVRGQHATDLETLVTTTEELERFRRELAMANEAKKAALGHADDAMKIAEVNAEKVEILSSEVVRLKGLLDSTAESEESKNRETEELVKNLESEVSVMKGKLEEARVIEERLAEMEKLIEELKSELADAKKAESEARQLFEEWKHKAGSLEMELEAVTLSEKIKSESLASTTEELGKIQSVLQDRESEIEVLKGKTTALEIEVARLLADVNESNEQIDASQQEVFGLQTTIDVLRNKLEVAEAAASEALYNEKIANAKIENLTEENVKLIGELNEARDREEEQKRTVEDLTASLNEESDKAKEAHERFLSKEDDHEHALEQIGDLKMALKSTKESYEVMLDEANYDITCLRKTVDGLEAEVNKYREEIESKEAEIVRLNQQSEEEIGALQVEVDKAVESLQDAEQQLQAANEEKENLQEKLRYAESACVEANKVLDETKAEKESLEEKLIYTEAAVAEANKAVQEATAENSQLKERLLDKENALQSLTQENDDFRLREADAMKKIDELSALLAEAMIKKHPEEEEKLVLVDEAHSSVREEASDSVVENGDAESENDKNPKLELDVLNRSSNGDVNHEEEKDETKVQQEEVKTECTTQESIKIVEKQPQPDRKQETVASKDELEPKEDAANGTVSEDASKVAMSPTKPQQQQKKNKPLLKKFGSLLKKKNSK
ncbi:WEB family protein At3g02930, chloroplastic-like [Oryza brachyantha]|uniref:WEB family protein n=1 Tax=Oryza brachyantha TaxID=4533 RepID=J3M3G2_ORYBR|nr:WEB family protein At3g02930, chloroplastic-like [Oryza brachyantha]XP_015693250.1 WEB family protein At3g02930, chloroplastic-like [Oryza brachyantha]